MNEPRKPLLLTEAEKASPLWQKILADAKYQLQILREQNDVFSLEPSKRAITCARIAMYKEFIRLNEQVVKIDQGF
jgi:hypothetical protein